RRFFETVEIGGQPVDRPAIAREMLAPGDLTQSLCAPWQFDYRHCECYYWAASRPDYVNVETRPDLTSDGRNWLDSSAEVANSGYIPDADDHPPRGLLRPHDRIAAWERLLRFVIGGREEAPPAPSPSPAPKP